LGGAPQTVAGGATLYAFERELDGSSLDTPQTGDSGDFQVTNTIVERGSGMGDTLVLAAGGPGAPGGASEHLGASAGGAAADGVGDVKFSGAAGGDGRQFSGSSGGGGGGSSAGTAANGNPGGSTSS